MASTKTDGKLPPNGDTDTIMQIATYMNTEDWDYNLKADNAGIRILTFDMWDSTVDLRSDGTWNLR